jgi:hypothetical protein
MGTLRLRFVPLVLLRLTIAGALVLGRTIANAADSTNGTQTEEVVVTGTRLKLERSANRSERASECQRLPEHGAGRIGIADRGSVPVQRRRN